MTFLASSLCIIVIYILDSNFHMTHGKGETKIEDWRYLAHVGRKKDNCNVCSHTLSWSKNNTSHPILSNSHPLSTANKAIHCLKWGQCEYCKSVLIQSKWILLNFTFAKLETNTYGWHGLCQLSYYVITDHKTVQRNILTVYDSCGPNTDPLRFHIETWSGSVTVTSMIGLREMSIWLCWRSESIESTLSSWWRQIMQKIERLEGSACP